MRSLDERGQFSTPAGRGQLVDTGHSQVRGFDQIRRRLRVERVIGGSKCLDCYCC
jgi:hypothetical protein